MLTLTEPLDSLDESSLIASCLKNTPGAFDILMKRYLKSVYSYAYHTVQNVELAEDITQETFLRVYRSLGKFDQKRPFKPWLFTIATNLCKTALKKNQTGPLLLGNEATEMNLLENIEDTHHIEDTLNDGNDEGMVNTAMAQLNPSVRQALILRHVNDLSYEDIAQMMGANLNTVRTWLKRGRENLKTLLEAQGGLTP